MRTSLLIILITSCAHAATPDAPTGLLTNDADEYVVADAVAFSPVAAPLPPGASIHLLDDDIDSSANTHHTNDDLANRQSGLLAPATFRANSNNGGWQSQPGTASPSLLLASFPGQATAGETLDMDLPDTGGSGASARIMQWPAYARPCHSHSET